MAGSGSATLNKKQLQANIGSVLWQVGRHKACCAGSTRKREQSQTSICAQLEQLEATAKDFQGDQSLLQQRL